jgi:hypothetical protein
MIRTKFIELTAIPAIGYRQKLISGDDAIVIIREDNAKVVFKTINKLTKQISMDYPLNETEYPKECFEEVYEKTLGLPYENRLSIRMFLEEDVNESSGMVDMISNDVYKDLLKRYTKDGKWQPEILANEVLDLMKKGKWVKELIRNGYDEYEIFIFCFQHFCEETLLDSGITRNDAALILTLIESCFKKSPFVQNKLYLNKLIRKYR